MELLLGVARHFGTLFHRYRHGPSLSCVHAPDVRRYVFSRLLPMPYVHVLSAPLRS